jgi:hypothetical protein
MEKLREMQEVFSDEGLELKLVGLEGHLAQTDHQTAARRSGPIQARRLTIMTHLENEPWIESLCTEQPQKLLLYASEHLHGRYCPFGQSTGILDQRIEPKQSAPQYVRIEVVGTSADCEAIVQQIRRRPDIAQAITIYADAVQLTRPSIVEV